MCRRIVLPTQTRPGGCVILGKLLRVVLEYFLVEVGKLRGKWCGRSLDSQVNDFLIEPLYTWVDDDKGNIHFKEWLAE